MYTVAYQNTDVFYMNEKLMLLKAVSATAFNSNNQYVPIDEF